MKFTYLKTPINKYTFKSTKIREWVESRCVGITLNAFAGKTKLHIKEYRIDKDKFMNAHCYIDIIDFMNFAMKKLYFTTILLDPPYSLRKSMEFYNGNKMSKFNHLKNLISYMKPKRVITFGYQSVSMGVNREYKQTEICLMNHGGAIHDTIAVVEDLIC
jgi:16S rRNA G966 N2-methylase RsmD